MSEMREIILDTTARIFTDLGAPQEIILAGDDGWKAPLWSALEEAGLTRAWLPEEDGGAGLSVTDSFAILRVAGRFAVAVPLAETLLAARLLSASGLAVPLGAIALVAPEGRAPPRLTDATLDGEAHGVTFAREAEHLALFGKGEEGPVVALVAAADCTIRAADGIAGEASDGVTFEAVPVLASAPAGMTEEAMRRLGAVVRATQMAGALEGLLEISVGYAQERVAFGRPIGKFQAVQHLLARLAEETAAAVAAVSSAALALETQPLDGEAVFIEAATAKIRVGEAAREGAMIAHQVHGAIGFTAEYPLHRFVQRLWSWRDDFGQEAQWALRLGRRAAAHGSRGFWPAITAA